MENHNKVLDEYNELVLEKLSFLNMTLIAEDTLSVLKTTGLIIEERANFTNEELEFIALLIQEHERAVKEDIDILEKETELVKIANEIDSSEYLLEVQNLAEHKLNSYMKVLFNLRAVDMVLSSPK